MLSSIFRGDMLNNFLCDYTVLPFNREHSNCTTIYRSFLMLWYFYCFLGVPDLDGIEEQTYLIENS